MKKTFYTSLLTLLSLAPLQAQVAKVTFDTDDYSAVGVYDGWENSPFRKGTLQGNVAVIDNPHTEMSDILGRIPNATEKVLAVQRSRYGSNLFGARIDLTTPFALTPEIQYVHVLVHRPVSGRVMLMGLGKHREAEWATQSPETVQFREISSTTVAPNMWGDAVFSVRGVSGVDIYSLVVVPECESPHDSSEDFVAYIDQIVVNSSSVPFVNYNEDFVNDVRESAYIAVPSPKSTLPAPFDVNDVDVRLYASFVSEGGYETPATPTISAETVTGGVVRSFDGTRITAPVAVPAGQDVTILLNANTGYTLTALHLSSSTGEEIDVPLASINLNRYDIPAALFAENAQVVVTPTFNPLPEGEQRAVQRWYLAWNDEFDSPNGAYAKPNATHWNTPSRGSSAWARFITDNDSTSFVRDGYYHARCFVNDDRTEDDIAMLSGAIYSRNLYSFQYGRVEARLKTTRHTGNFPAFWMMPQDNSAGWPAAGEIDIFEQVNNQNIAYHTIHSNWSYTLGNKTNPKSSGNEAVNMDEWHVYALEWDEAQLRWYVDGQQVFSYAKKVADEDALSKGQWPFDKKFYLILNQSVGNGSWAASPDQSFTYETLFDYVRVYQIKKTGKDNSDYPINYPKTQPVTHATRRLTAVCLDDQIVNVPNPACLYNFIPEPVFTVALGQLVQPSVTFSTGWMHSYVYLDLDGDSIFTPITPNQGVQPALSELMSYSFFSENSYDGSGFNSEGTAFTARNANTLQLPAFTIPATMSPGLYRIRFKIDWDDIDAGGSTALGQDIITNGGAICDVNIYVEDPTGLDAVNLNNQSRNSEWYDLQGRRIPAPTKSGIYIQGNRKVILH